MKPLPIPAGTALVTAVLLALTALAAGLVRWPIAPLSLAHVALGFAALKAWLVADHFMELRHAPWTLRGLVLGWIVLVCGGLALSFV